MRPPINRLLFAILTGIGVAVIGAGVFFIERTPSGGLSNGGTGELTLSERDAANYQAEVCSSRNAAGTGLKGEYFQADELKGPPQLSRIDGVVDYDSNFELSMAGNPAAVHSARWSGWVKPPISGRYLFHAGDSDARIYVSNQLVSGDGASPGGAIEMVAGRFYPVLLEVSHIQALGKGRVRFEWTAPHGMRYVIPRALLFPPSETVATGKPTPS